MECTNDEIDTIAHTERETDSGGNDELREGDVPNQVKLELRTVKRPIKMIGVQGWTGTDEGKTWHVRETVRMYLDVKPTVEYNLQIE